MAYFGNNTEAEPFMDQCSKCIFGDKPCPIAFAQFTYNYEAVNNKTATEILNILVQNNGSCSMFKEFKEYLTLK